MKSTQRGNLYSYAFTAHSGGVGSVYKGFREIAFMQGDEAVDLLTKLDAIDGNERFTIEELIDLVLGAYNDGMDEDSEDARADKRRTLSGPQIEGE